MRPNLFANTPDILHDYLQNGGRPAFQVRLVLAATLGAQLRHLQRLRAVPRTCRCAKAARNISTRRSTRSGRATSRRRTACAELIGRINAHPARPPGAAARLGARVPRHRQRAAARVQQASPDGRDLVLVVVNLDPTNMQHGFVQLPLADWGLTPRYDRSRSHDLLVGRALLLARRMELRAARSAGTASRTSSRRASPATGPGAAVYRRRSRTTDAMPTIRTPLWFKDAVIYQAHVRAFFDSNNDGIGDFPGLTRSSTTCRARRQLPLAAAVLSLAAARRRLRHRRLREHPSELRHARRLRPVHRRGARRGIRVITELVINHTSDQHPWFQAARRAPAGSPRARLLRLERHQPEVRRASASSSPTPRRRTGRGTTPRRRTTGTASSITSPI